MLWIGSNGLGDVLCATPILKKLYNVYGEKISVCTSRPLVFKNNPYVNKIYNLEESTYKDELENHIVHKTFDYPVTVNGVDLKHNLIHIVQYHAVSLGIQLLSNECNIEYFADDYDDIYELPDNYVVVHPSMTWASRTWSMSSWQGLIDKLNQNNIFVVVVGRDGDKCVDGMLESKDIYNLKINYGISLVNQTNLSQTWHLINNSDCVVLMDSGLLHLSGATDSYIIHLGSSFNPEYRSPYRNGNQRYKYDYILGSCDFFCASDMKYGLKEHGSIHGVPPLMKCLEDKNSFECHPSVEDVYSRVKKLTGCRGIIYDIVEKYDEINLLDPMAWQTVNGRFISLEYVFKLLKNKDRPVHILETGCMRGGNLNEAFYEGASTLLFSDFVKNYNGGFVTTIDINPNNLKECKKLISQFSEVISYQQSDSVSYLKNMTDEEIFKIDLFYLDSFDLDFNNPSQSMSHNVEEVNAIIDRVSDDAIILIDDNWLKGTILPGRNDALIEDIGKGLLAKELLVEKGWKMEINPRMGVINQ